MKQQANHLKKLRTSYLRRKSRVNHTIKSHHFDHRLLVSKSNMHTYAQVIDARGFVVCGMSDATYTQSGKVAKALELGKAIAGLCKEKGITSVVFDRNGYLYHGRVKALAEGAREGGLVF